jgi:hypothetical protein
MDGISLIKIEIADVINDSGIEVSKTIHKIVSTPPNPRMANGIRFLIVSSCNAIRIGVQGRRCGLTTTLRGIECLEALDTFQCL